MWTLHDRVTVRQYVNCKIYFALEEFNKMAAVIFADCISRLRSKWMMCSWPGVSSFILS